VTCRQEYQYLVLEEHSFESKKSQEHIQFKVF